MSGLSKMIADFFVRENVIEHEEYEIYKYGSDILIENIGTTIFLICLGFICKFRFIGSPIPLATDQCFRS